MLTITRTKNRCGLLIVVVILTAVLTLGYKLIFLRPDSQFALETSPISCKSASESLKHRLTNSEASWKLSVEKRKKLIGGNVGSIDPWSNIYFWEYFLPTFSCPFSIDRIGSFGDGGKYVCGLELYRSDAEGLRSNGDPSCIVYSFGVSVESSFEAEILNRTNCRIYAYDASVEQMGPQISKTHPRVHFQKMFLGPEATSDTQTLDYFMKQNGHDYIDILKMDIEQSDIPSMNQIMDHFDVLPFGQLQIEFHMKPYRDQAEFVKFHTLWERMEDKGLRPFKNEVNLWTGVALKKIPYIIEYSFINIRGNRGTFTL